MGRLEWSGKDILVYLSCYSQTKIQKGRKFIGYCVIPSSIVPASSFQLIDFHCWLSHVHLLLGGHFISLLLTFFCLLGTPPHVCVTFTNINCLLSTEWYTFCTVDHEIQGGWLRQSLHKITRAYSQSHVLCCHLRVFSSSILNLKIYNVYVLQ